MGVLAAPATRGMASATRPAAARTGADASQAAWKRPTLIVATTPIGSNARPACMRVRCQASSRTSTEVNCSTKKVHEYSNFTIIDTPAGQQPQIQQRFQRSGAPAHEQHGEHPVDPEGCHATTHPQRISTSTGRTGHIGMRSDHRGLPLTKRSTRAAPPRSQARPLNRIGTEHRFPRQRVSGGPKCVPATGDRLRGLRLAAFRGSRPAWPGLPNRPRGARYTDRPRRQCACMRNDAGAGGRTADAAQEW